VRANSRTFPRVTPSRIPTSSAGVRIGRRPLRTRFAVAPSAHCRWPHTEWPHGLRTPPPGLTHGQHIVEVVAGLDRGIDGSREFLVTDTISASAPFSYTSGDGPPSGWTMTTRRAGRRRRDRDLRFHLARHNNPHAGLGSPLTASVSRTARTISSRGGAAGRSAPRTAAKRPSGRSRKTSAAIVPLSRTRCRQKGSSVEDRHGGFLGQTRPAADVNTD